MLLHLAFIVFALAGGVLVLFRGHIAWIHLPAVAWAAYAEFTATICPLTPLENSLRKQAGQEGYDGGFVEHYLIPLIYPAALTPRLQMLIGAIVVAVNVAVYAVALCRRSGRRSA